MVLQRIDQLRLEWRAAARGAERAIARRAAGAAGDLREFGRGQPAELVAVILAVAGKGDVVDVEIEPHADGIGGDEIIDIAILEHRHLRIACAWAERAEHYGGAAMLAADQLGNGVDFI